MKITRKVMVLAFAVNAAVAVGCAIGMGRMYRAVRTYEKRHNVSVLSPENEITVRMNCDPPVGGTATNGVAKAGSEASRAKKDDAREEGASPFSCVVQEGMSDNAGGATNAMAKIPPQMKVLDIRYDGETSLDIRLSADPDMESARRYVRVAPLRAGTLGFSCDRKYNRRAAKYEPHLIVTGDFAFRTNVTLVVRKGLPISDKGGRPAAEGALAADFTYSFSRKDIVPFVRFAADGRYLPPGGKHALAVESVNAAKIHTEIQRVAPQNVVQMLAREEGAYERHNRNEWRAGREEGADNADTGELAAEATARDWTCRNRLNEKETTSISVVPTDGGATNGIYLVAIRNGD